jgi:hypothetical protein
MVSKQPKRSLPAGYAAVIEFYMKYGSAYSMLGGHSFAVLIRRLYAQI